MRLGPPSSGGARSAPLGTQATPCSFSQALTLMALVTVAERLTGAAARRATRCERSGLAAAWRRPCTGAALPAAGQGGWLRGQRRSAPSLDGLRDRNAAPGRCGGLPGPLQAPCKDDSKGGSGPARQEAVCAVACIPLCAAAGRWELWGCGRALTKEWRLGGNPKRRGVQAGATNKRRKRGWAALIAALLGLTKLREATHASLSGCISCAWIRLAPSGGRALGVPIVADAAPGGAPGALPAALCPHLSPGCCPRVQPPACGIRG